MQRRLVFAAFSLFAAAFSRCPGQVAAPDVSVFGQAQQSEAALVGVMYDLKQTSAHQPTGVNPVTYYDVISKFLSNGWDDQVLDAYYQVSRPLYTTQIFVPGMSADQAPKAFGAEKTVKPSLWVIHYKAQVTPPEPGTYRFWGCADDLMCAAVNGKTELVYYFRVPTPKFWTQSEPDGAVAGGTQLRAGDWFTVKGGEVIDLDVLIGECPGGSFCAFLMIEKRGATYEMKDGHPLLPIFQVATHDMPPSQDVNSEPYFAKEAAPWKSLQ